MLSAEALKKGLPRYARVTASPRPAAGEIAGRVIWTGREERVMKSSQYVRGSYFYRMFFWQAAGRASLMTLFIFVIIKPLLPAVSFSSFHFWGRSLIKIHYFWGTRRKKPANPTSDEMGLAGFGAFNLLWREFPLIEIQNPGARGYTLGCWYQCTSNEKRRE